MFDLNKMQFDKYVEKEINKDLSMYWYKRSKKKVILPREYSEDLVYFIGALIGDGSIHKLIKRKRGGNYHKISFTGSYEYMKIIEKLIEELFGWKSIIDKRKHRENSWRLETNSYIIHKFFTDVIGIPAGKKVGNIYFLENLKIPKKYYKYLLAGLIDTDGYVSSKYIGLIQKDKKFLEQIKILSKENLKIEFKGPYVNRKINNIPVGWIISVCRKDDIKAFINLIPLRYKKLNMPLEAKPSYV